MIAQAHRRPQCRKRRRRRDVDRIQILRGDSHRFALILPEVRDQRSQLIDHRHARRHQQDDRECARRDHARHRQPDQRHRPYGTCRFDARPLPCRRPFRHATPELRIDRQRGVTLHHDAAEPRHDQRQRRQHTIAEDECDRRKGGDHHEHRQRPGLHERERQIFGIVGRPVAGLGMMEVVNALIHEGRHQHGHPDQRIIAEPKAGQRRMLHMSQLVDEAHPAVQREDRDHARHDRQPQGAGRQRNTKRRIADHRGADEIAPVDRRVRRVKITREVGSSLQHRAIVRNGRARCVGGHRPRESHGRHGHVHWPKIVAIRWRKQTRPAWKGRSP